MFIEAERSATDKVLVVVAPFEVIYCKVKSVACLLSTVSAFVAKDAVKALEIVPEIFADDEIIISVLDEFSTMLNRFFFGCATNIIFSALPYLRSNR